MATSMKTFYVGISFLTALLVSSCSSVNEIVPSEDLNPIEKMAEIVEPVEPIVRSEKPGEVSKKQPVERQIIKGESQSIDPETEPRKIVFTAEREIPNIVTEDEPTINKGPPKILSEKPAVRDPDVKNPVIEEPSPVDPSTILIDISDQFSEVIDGVPIIKNPKRCQQGDLEIGVTVERVPSSKGMIVADLHNDVPEDFLKWDKVILRVILPAQKGETYFCMPLTKSGDYAIVTYHDKNGNNSFDRNFLGIPKERFGASGNPKVKARAPRFQEAKISVPETGLDIRVKLHKASDILGGQ